MFTIKVKCKRVKDAFYDELVIVYDYCRESQKSLLVILNTKVGRNVVYSLTTGNSSLHNESNGNGNKLIMFAAAREMFLCSYNISEQKYSLSDLNITS